MSGSREPAKHRRIAALGHGGMARVYLTVSSGPAGVNKLVVVKELREELARDPDFVTMFLDEARLAVRLNHPNVIQTYEVRTDAALPAIVMEFLEGQPLHVLLGRVGRSNMPLTLHVWIIARVLAGLQYAHELRDYDGTRLGVVHRDVSPQNVFLTYAGQVKLVDFGIAKASGTAAVTRTGVVKGKVGYIAPEQVLCHPVDERADLFAAGVMLWEALARQRLALGEEVAVLHARVTGNERKIKDINPDAPDELCAICERAMALEPDDRYPTAAAFQDALESYLDTSAKRVGERDLAALASSTFAKERAEIAAKIDARLRGGGDGDDERLPSLSIAPERPRSSEDEETRDAVAAPSASSKREPPPTVSTGARPVRRVRYALLGLAALPVIALAAMFAIRRAELDPAIPPPTAANEQMTAAPVQTEAPATSAPEPTTIVLSVTVKPPDAVVTLDGARLPSNPFESQMPRDGAAHKLRVVAEGHLADERLIVFDRDRAVAVELQETAPPSARGAPRPRRPTSSSTPPKPSGSPAAPGPDADLSKDAARPRRTIDEKDPYPR